MKLRSSKQVRRSLRLTLGAIGALGGLAPAISHADILSSKRGLADSNANYTDLQATNAGWYYTWGTGPANPGNYNAKFYPMFWNAPSQTTITNVKNTNPDYVLGFNEPERSDQANMTVAQAISSWTTISNSFTGTSVKLVSPAVADTLDGQAWIASFMSQAKAANLKVDAVAFHWYAVSNPNNPASAASAFLGRVDTFHSSYNLPVFITEFAIHDWGGNYTDAQIAEANRQFLNIVIPGLESRSYVAGYAWYGWFSDARLFTGSSTLTPTTLSYSYIGAISTGSTADLNAVDLGEHVADLTGGTLTMTGGAGTVRYINALSSTSTITGGIDWGLNPAGTTNWVRVQPGATLLKNGANTITLGGGTIANDGVIQVAQGVLRISAPTSGAGSILISSTGDSTGSTARLELSGNVSVSNAITFAQRSDPGGSDGIRNVSGTNTLWGAMNITNGGTQARVRSDAGLLTLGGPVTTDATTARNLYLQGAGNGAVSGAISDNAGNVSGKINLFKQDSGTWTLSGANTYTGTTIVNAGTLGYTKSPSNIGSVTVADNAGLRIGAAAAGSTTLTATSVTLGTSGPTALTFDFDALDAAGPLVATGVFTAGGTVNVAIQNAGALSAGSHTLVGYTSFAGGGTFAGTNFTLGPRSTGTLVNNGVNALTLNVTGDRPVWTGADNGNWLAGMTGANKNWKLQAAPTSTDYLEGDNVLFDDSAAGATTVNINTASISPAATTFNNSTKSYTVTSSGGLGIAGTGRLTKNGTGTVTLSTVNTYTGTTTLNAGTLSISINSNLGADAAPVTLNGGTLKTTNSGRLTNTHAFTIAGATTLNIASTGSAGTGQILFNTPNTLLGSGPLTVTGNGTLGTTGAGNVRVAQINGYSGNITLQSGGSFEYGVGGAVGSTATFAIGNNGELIATDGVTLANTITVSGGTNSIISFANGATGIVSGDITLSANATIALRNWYSTGTVTGGTISGRITGAGALTVNSGTGNNGLLTLSSTTSTYAGGTTISASQLFATANAALGTGPVTIGGTNAELQLDSGVNVANALTINAGAGQTGEGIVYVATSGVSATYSGAVTINAVQAAGGHFAANSGTLTVTGKITSSVPVSTRAGTVVFTNTTSSYSALAVVGGTAKVGATNAIPAAATVTLGGGSVTGTFDVGGFNQTLAGVTVSTASNAGGVITNSGGAVATLTTTGTYSYAGIIQDGAADVALTVNGGAATLTGANTYTGQTTVTTGTLNIASANIGAGTAASVAGGTLILSNIAALGTAANIQFPAGSTGTLDLALSSGNNVPYTFSTVTTSNITLLSNLAANGAGTSHTLGSSTLGGGTITIAAGAHVTSGTASLALGAVSLTAGSTQTTTFNPTSANVSLASVTNGSGQLHTLELGGTAAANQILGNILAPQGTLNLLKSNTSTWTLLGSGGYNGTTAITGGALRVGNGGTVGALNNFAVTISAPGVLDFNRSDTVTFANPVGGSGTLEQVGTGSLNVTGSTQTWTSGAILNAKAGTTNLKSDPGSEAAYNLAINVTPSTGGATLHVASSATDAAHLRDLRVNGVGSGGAGMLIIDAATNGASSNPRTGFGAVGSSVAVYIGDSAGGSGFASRATIENLWRSAALEGYWALQNHLVTAVSRGLTLDAVIVTDPSKNGLAILPSVDNANNPVTYVGEDIQGDTNGDATVDINDLGVVLQHLNTSPGSQAGEAGFTIYTPGEGDVNGDLAVNINDLGAVLGHLNEVYSPASNASGTGDVPEPGVCALLLLGSTSLLARTRRARRSCNRTDNRSSSPV